MVKELFHTEEDWLKKHDWTQHNAKPDAFAMKDMIEETNGVWMVVMYQW